MTFGLRVPLHEERKRGLIMSEKIWNSTYLQFYLNSMGKIVIKCGFVCGEVPGSRYTMLK